MTISLGPILRASVIAGLIAAVLAAGFHLIATEPVIDQAIQFEEAAHAGGDAGQEAEPVVSRGGQRAGLVLGFAMYGLMWALIFAVAFRASQPWLPDVGAGRRGLLLAGLAYWAVALLPFLRYPAQPPGVGDPATIGERQAAYVACLALSVGSVVVAIAFSRWASRRWRIARPAGQLLALAAALITLGAAVVGLPPTPLAEPTEIDGLIRAFQYLALTGLAIYWLAFGLIFARLIRAASRASSRARVALSRGRPA